MIGDVLFFKNNKKSFISKIISKMTNSDYTHVGLIIEKCNVTGVVTIIESNRFINTVVSSISLDDKMYTVYTTGNKSEEQTKRIVKYAYRNVGIKYDYAQILGIFISLISKGKINRYFNNKNKIICSELIDLAYYTSGIRRLTEINLGNVTPQELLSVYDFRIRSEG